MTARIPLGATVSDWQDVGTPDTYRTVSIRRHYEVENSGHYVEAYAMQNADGTLEEAAVRAQLDVWQHHVHHHWDNPLTPVEARLAAAKLAAAAAEITQLSLMFEAAAQDVEKWVTP